jgi:hypothetical protein
MCVALSGNRILSEYLASVGTSGVRPAADDAMSSSELIEAP